ncbi:Xylose isomerase domain-containing protein TIM barrel [Alicyclobacillus hesperidum URH17-3-68]|uniref:restriction endonuclease n=1 Tax=Alicyclobacillus hesperidum TaxID=89784 RepID=UPI000281BB55|nr:restriction endonuclease [Alicyclobacillus hesperidum]EJY56373.1 Xylose isomerase domain-containing protein TIM barrel [Alicyclobacillus hesperidum URH17-3-68]
MLKTLSMDKHQLATEIGLTFSGLAKSLPLGYYSQVIVGAARRKVYHRMAQQHYRLKSLMAGSLLLSPPAATLLMRQREAEFDLIAERWRLWMDDFLSSTGGRLSVTIDGFPLAATELLGRCLSMAPLLLPRPSEYIYLEDGDAGVDWSLYYRQLSLLLDDMEDDIKALHRHFEQILSQITWPPFDEELATAREALASRLTQMDYSHVPFTVSSLLPYVRQVHASNAPFLWRDILAVMGHDSIEVTDRTGDGNKDLVSTFQGETYYTQVKTVGNPIGEEVIRQFASTCRTYQVKRGYYVTTFRYARDAQYGQWPQLAPQRKLELRDMYGCLT